MPAAHSSDNASPVPNDASRTPEDASREAALTLGALDALIVGAGPVGLTLACELARYGLRIRIVDSAPAPSDKSRALAVWPRTLEQLDRMGLAQTFAANGIHAQHALFFAGKEQIARVALDSVASPFPFGLMIPQDQTERLLTEHLTTLGVPVDHSRTFQSYTDSCDYITAVLAAPDGETETVTARWLLGCDGAHSAVRHAIGAEFTGDTLPSDWVLADFQQHDDRRVDTVELHLHADGVLALFPIPPDRLRVIANTTHGNHANAPATAPSTATAPPTPSGSDIQRILDARGGKGITVRDTIWLSGFHINERKVADFRRGRVFLAGDAAHIHSPAGGQGMNTGMQDAVNLAWKLALVHSGQLSSGGNEILLESYTAERSPVAENVLKGSGKLTRMGTLDNPFFRTLRNGVIHLAASLPTVQHFFAEQITELAVSYPHTKLNAAHGRQSGPKPGERAPLNESPASPVSNGSQPQFTLFAAPGANASQLIACYAELFDPQPRPPFTPGGIWIVRPDGYVGFAGDSDGWASADAYLGKLK